MKTFDWLYLLMSAIVMSVMITFMVCTYGDNGGNNNHYVPIKVVMTENPIISDTTYDTIYVEVLDQDAYNVGYFDGNSDAYYQFDSINNAYADND